MSLMSFRSIWRTMVFEIKSLRIYWLYITTMMIFVPLSYLAVILFFTSDFYSTLPIALTGFIVVTGFTTLVLPVAHRVSNIYDDDVIELLASLPVGVGGQVVAVALTYTFISLPQIVAVLTILEALVGVKSIVYLITSLLFMYLLDITTAILLGLVIRNKLILDPLLSIILLAVIVVTPAYYSYNAITGIYKLIVVANPLTHIVSLLRSSIGVDEGIPVILSVIYLAVLTTGLLACTLTRLKQASLTMLEKK